MVEIQDIVITLALGGIMLMFILSQFSSLNPTTAQIANDYFPNYTSSYNTMQQMIEDTQDEMKVQVDPSPENALASALGGIAVFTVEFVKILLTTFSSIIDMPKAFLNITLNLIVDILDLSVEDPSTRAFIGLTTTIYDVLSIIIVYTIILGLAAILTGKALQL